MSDKIVVSPKMVVTVFESGWRTAYLEMCGMLFSLADGEKMNESVWQHLRDTTGCQIIVIQYVPGEGSKHLYENDALDVLGWSKE
jgi:hypothetical protein